MLPFSMSLVQSVSNNKFGLQFVATFFTNIKNRKYANAGGLGSRQGAVN